MTTAQKQALKAARSPQRKRTCAEAYAQMQAMLATRTTTKWMCGK